MENPSVNARSQKRKLPDSFSPTQPSEQSQRHSCAESIIDATRELNGSSPIARRLKETQTVIDSNTAIHPTSNMAEPPAKRARRTDSSAMWDQKEGSASPRPHSMKVHPSSDRGQNGERGPSTYKRDERRSSRSRDRDRQDRGHRDMDRARNRPRRDDRDESDRRDRDRRDRDRSRSRDKHSSRRDIPTKPARARDRSRSPIRNSAPVRTRSPPRGPRGDRARQDSAKPEPKPAPQPSKDVRNGDAMQVDKPNGINGDVENDEDIQLRRLMGFTTFKSTHDTKVPGNNVYGVRKEKQTQYRQYMNRVGGFNRPLSPSRE